MLMEGKREGVVREEVKEKDAEFRDYESKYTVLLTAGTALLMLGLKKVFIMVLLIEQWRLWVFTILNLVLVAIFLTSMDCKSSSHQFQNQETGNDNVKVEKVIKEMKKQCCVLQSADEDHQDQAPSRSKNRFIQRELMSTKYEEVAGMEDLDHEAEPPGLSKEELNERAEAFIATFRQHLVLDARKGREVQFFNKRGQRQHNQ